MTRENQTNTGFEGLNLETVWQRQADRLIMLGFHKELGLSEEEYRDTLPKFLPQPDRYKGLFDIPLIVDPRVPLDKLCKMTKIESSFFLGHDNVLRNVIDIPYKPFTAWTHDATRYRNISTDEAREKIAKNRTIGIDEAPSQLIEVVSLFLQYPEFFGQVGVIAAGSYYSSLWLLVPKLDISSGRIEINLISTNKPNERLGVLSRGKITSGFDTP